MSMGLCARSLTMVLYNGASCISEHLSDVAGPPYLSPNKLIECASNITSRTHFPSGRADKLILVHALWSWLWRPTSGDASLTNT